jgi:sarcosine oxidase subunit beta
MVSLPNRKVRVRHRPGWGERERVRFSDGDRPDVVIIGAGVIGAATAFELGKRGLRTLNVDKLPTAGYGSTSNSCAIVRTHYSSRDGVALAHESVSYWDDWRAHVRLDGEADLAHFKRTGVVVLKSATRHYEKSVTHFREVGVAFEDWDADELRRRYALLATSSFYPPKHTDDPTFGVPGGELEGAIFTSDAGYVVDAMLATQNLQRAAEAVGGRFLFNVPVSGVRQSGGRVAGITLADGTSIDAPIVVNVAGPHSFLVNQMAEVEGDMKVRTRALRHEVHVVPAPDGCDVESQVYTTSDGDLGIYFRPDAGNQILVGSEDPKTDEREWIEHPDEFDRHVTERQWTTQVHRLAVRIPGLGVPSARRGVVDLYDVSDDWMPIYDRSSLPGFYMAIGSSGNQFKTAPVAGRLMAELIERVENGHDHDRDPVTVRLPYTGLDLNLGAYSRLREVNAESSFSVLG